MNKTYDILIGNDGANLSLGLEFAKEAGIENEAIEIIVTKISESQEYSVLVDIDSFIGNEILASKNEKAIDALIARIGKPLPCSIIPSIHRPTPLARKLLHALQESFAPEVSPTVIRDHETLREAVSFGQSVLDFAPGCEAEKDFEALVTWLEEKYSPPMPEVEVISAAGGRAAELARRVATLKFNVEHEKESPIIGRIYPDVDFE